MGGIGINDSELPKIPAVYVLEGKTSKKKIKRTYVGATISLHDRIIKHRAKKSSYGRLTGGDFQVGFYLPAVNFRAALVLEKIFKKFTAKRRWAIINQWREHGTTLKAVEDLLVTLNLTKLVKKG